MDDERYDGTNGETLGGGRDGAHGETYEGRRGAAHDEAFEGPHLRMGLTFAGYWNNDGDEDEDEDDVDGEQGVEDGVRDADGNAGSSRAGGFGNREGVGFPPAKDAPGLNKAKAREIERQRRQGEQGIRGRIGNLEGVGSVTSDAQGRNDAKAREIERQHRQGEQGLRGRFGNLEGVGSIPSEGEQGWNDAKARENERQRRQGEQGPRGRFGIPEGVGSVPSEDAPELNKAKARGLERQRQGEQGLRGRFGNLVGSVPPEDAPVRNAAKARDFPRSYEIREGIRSTSAHANAAHATTTDARHTPDRTWAVAANASPLASHDPAAPAHPPYIAPAFPHLPPRTTTTPRAVIALGVFDGVHAGHRALLASLRREAQSHRAASIAYTFSGHPMHVLHPASEPARLMTLREKVSAIARLGIDRVVVRPFTEAFANTPARDFLEELRARYGMVALVAGHDVHVGRGGEGDAAFLEAWAREVGVDFVLVPPLLRGGAPVSSTGIRERIGKGWVRSARQLGYLACATGVVQPGKRLGRRIDFPTLNVALPRKALPRAGVYEARVWLQGRWWRAVANLGSNPTVEDGTALKLEAHVLGFHGDAYGETVTVVFWRFLRGEQRFASVEALKAQIASDVRRVMRGDGRRRRRKARSTHAPLPTGSADRRNRGRAAQRPRRLRYRRDER